MSLVITVVAGIVALALVIASQDHRSRWGGLLGPRRPHGRGWGPPGSPSAVHVLPRVPHDWEQEGWA